MGIVFFVVFAGVIFAVAAAHKRQVDSAWGDVAGALGLHLSTGGFFSRPTISGRIGSIDVHVRTVNRGKNNVYTVYSVRYPARTRPFRLTREHMLSGFAKLFGAEDLTIGDHRFDTAFMVQAEDPGGLANYLTSGRRIELVSYAATNRTIAVTESTVESTFRGTDSNADRIISRIRRIVSVAEHLGADDDRFHERDVELIRREGGDLEEAVRSSRSSGEADRSGYGVRMAEVEAMVVADELDDARAETTRLARDLPADEELEGWMRQIEHVAAREPAPPPAGDVPADEVIQDLFGTTKLSFETAERFRHRYKNQEIDWQGVVKSVRSYASDRDFGPHAGTKAVVTIAEVQHDLYGQNTIDAIVQFPAESELDRGDVITFTGRLVKVDPLMRNIYVAGGTLVED